MPPKPCAKCTKTVYPTEELKCLDKVWHKGCFRCDSCNMSLNMKNYKGYNKLPYCNAHYPQTKFTAVADTPENRRLTKNTAQQSNIQYHKDFDANKDKYTQVVDTPSFRAIRRNKEYSMIKYHEEFEKQKGKKITVADDPEVLRVKRNMDVVSNISYHGDRDKKQEMERIRPAEQVEAGRHRQNPGRIADYDPEERFAGVGANMGGTPYSNRNSASARQVYDSSVGRAQPPPQQQQPYQPPPQQYQPPAPAEPPQQKDKQAGKGMVCQALYDYEAADGDEVSFSDGDLIVFCQPIDEGWMEGTVEKTGQRGMLPSNYVEKLN